MNRLYDNELYKLLQEIRKCPAIYLGEKSIVKLEAFINGYTSHPKYNYATDDCFDGFNEFMYKRHNIKTTHNWAQIILFYSYTDAQAFDQFFREFDEFSKLSKEDLDNIIKASPFN